MRTRTVKALLAALLALVLAAPTFAAPRDPEGCERMANNPISDYCETNP